MDEKADIDDLVALLAWYQDAGVDGALADEPVDWLARGARPPGADFVWPHPNGSVRGVGVEPLHPAVPFAAMQDARLYEMLALFDALRVGKARERGMALERLQAIIDPHAPQNPRVPMYG